MATSSTARSQIPAVPRPNALQRGGVVIDMAAARAVRATPPLPPRLGARRYSGALLLSAAFHVALFIVIGSFSVRMVTRPQLIRVTIEEAAPPPPPLGEPSGTTEKVAAPSQPIPIPQPEPEKPKPVQPIRPRRPAPSQAPQHEPSTAPPADTAVPFGDRQGTADGVIGGVVGGQPGGTLGGRGDRPIPADQVATAPVVIARTMPVYPPLARARGTEGLVVLEAIVDRAGHVEPDSLHVVESVPQLDDAALAALRQWRFQPGRNASGEPVRVLLQVPVRFQLR